MASSLSLLMNALVIALQVFENERSFKFLVQIGFYEDQCKTRENSNFLKKGKTVISVKKS